MVNMEGSNDPISNAIEKVPAIIDKVSGFINKKKNGGTTEISDGGITDESVPLN
jgi:uncharacterized spore protein YtfJ